MIKISTFKETYEIPFQEDLECSLGFYNRTDGRVVIRFFRGDLGMPWDSNYNEDTIFSFSVDDGVIHMETSLSVNMNVVFLDIIDMVESELILLNSNKDKRGDYNHNDAVHIVLGETYNRLNREKKIKSILK